MRYRTSCWLMAAALLAVAAPAFTDDVPRAAVTSLGPWPPAPTIDPSNRASGQAAAIALGARLFSSPRLSGDAGIRCATCHEQWRGFVDAKPVARGVQDGHRNTPTLLNVGGQRWYGWDGANDSLWAQSIRPMLDAREMNSSAAHVAALLRGDPELVEGYTRAFGTTPGADDEKLLADVGKALAAYQETLASGRTPFDDYRDALVRGDTRAAARYPAQARRGLAVFVGRGGCVACHSGPRFSDGGFHRSLIAGAPGDQGRRDGLAALAASPFTLLGAHNDDHKRAAGAHTSDALREAKDEAKGFIRTPSLREAAATGPYMHDGSIANLCDALQPHAQSAVRLTPQEQADILAFVRTLTVEAEPPFADPETLRCR